MIRFPVLLAIGVLVSMPLYAQEPEPHQHSGATLSREAEIDSLATNLDNMIKACTSISVRGGTPSKAVLPQEQLALDKGILEYSDIIPPQLQSISKPELGSFKFGKWFDPHATILILAYDNSPLCRALVMDSKWIDDVRPKLYELVQSDNFWKPEQIDLNDPKPNEHWLRSRWAADIGGKITPSLQITADTGPLNPGKPRMIITLSVLSKGS